ncbi:hypothetical protein UAW_03002, partial [Enterococcus haemoperoxidus ATCC BAA-382]
AAGGYELEITAHSKNDEWTFTKKFRISEEEAVQLNEEAVEIETKPRNKLVVTMIVSTGLIILFLLVVIFILWRRKKIIVKVQQRSDFLKKIGLYNISIVVSFLILFCLTERCYASKEIDVAGWETNFGLTKNMYRTNEYLMDNNGIAKGYVLDSSNQVVEDSIYVGNAVTLGYFGEDINSEATVNGKYTKDKYFSVVKGDEFRLKNVGSYNGRALELVMKVTTNTDKNNLKLILLNKDPKLPAVQFRIEHNFEASYDFDYYVVDQLTQQKIPGLKIMFPMNVTDDFSGERYRKATLFSPNANLIMEKDAPGLYRFLRKPSKAPSAIYVVQGKDNSAVTYSLSIYNDASETISIGQYIPNDTAIYGTLISFFDPNIKKISPQSYDKVKLDYVEDQKGQVDFTIRQDLPYQALDVYYPEELVLDYSKDTADLNLTEPILSYGDQKVSRDEYEYKEGKFVFNKAFLKKYHASETEKNKELIIDFRSQIDYSAEKTLVHHQPNSRNFTYLFQIHSHSKKQNPLNGVVEESTEAEYSKDMTVSYPLELKVTDLKAKVDLDSKISDYDLSEFVQNPSSNFPKDNLKVLLKDDQIKFSKVGPIDVPFILKSNLLNVEQEFIAKVTVTAEPITSEYFENQAWLIDEINKQFASKGKKIDVNLYMRDLLSITSIVNRSGADFKGQHIPKTIASLKNLEEIDLKNKYLVGTLPDELGSLTKLKKLSIFGNSFSGEIPRSLSKLENLEFLALDDNKLSGTIPPGIEKLTKLKQVYLNKNQLIGSIPLFDLGPFSNFDIGETQLTYNENKSPSFISKVAQYKQSFVVGTDSLFLTGNINLAITTKGTIIKPFDPSDRGFLNLHAQKTNKTKVELYSEHTFKIINKKSNQVLYNGPVNKSLEIKVDPAEIYQVIMDGADKNPNNITEFETKLREYKFSEVPKSLSLDLKLGDLGYQPVKISSKDNLILFDNRLNSQWQLRIKTSELKSKKRTMAGSYFYKSKDEVPVEIPVSDTFKTIEKGNSEPDMGTINLSKEWNDKRGLFYKQANTGNYKDSYSGKIDWQLIDVPTGGK